MPFAKQIMAGAAGSKDPNGKTINGSAKKNEIQALAGAGASNRA